jgi:hypothetical protein
MLQTTASNTQDSTRKSNQRWSSLAWCILQASHPYSPLFTSPFLKHFHFPNRPSSKYLESSWLHALQSLDVTKNPFTFSWLPPTFQPGHRLPGFSYPTI